MPPAQADAQNPSTDLRASNAIDEPPRIYWPYSVVDGGVRSSAEVIHVVETDGLVRRHYADIRIDNLRSATLDRTTLLFVSYRKRGAIYWTKHPIRIPEGEAVLSDGDHLIRSRCGNRLSTTPMKPTSPDEPQLAELDPLPVPQLKAPEKTAKPAGPTIPGPKRPERTGNPDEKTPTNPDPARKKGDPLTLPNVPKVPAVIMPAKNSNSGALLDPSVFSSRSAPLEVPEPATWVLLVTAGIGVGTLFQNRNW
jgi:hypothetical protein